MNRAEAWVFTQGENYEDVQRDINAVLAGVVIGTTGQRLADMCV